MCHILHPAPMLITHEQMVLHFCAPITETKIIFTYTKTEAWFWVLGWFLSILTIIGNGLYYLPCIQQTTTPQKNQRVCGVACRGRPLCRDKCVSFTIFVRDNKSSRLFTKFTERDVDRTLAFSRRLCGVPV